jgi:hypothetical protein
VSRRQASALRTQAGQQGAPVMRRAGLLPSRYAPPPIASLSAVPSVQRKCAACEEERSHPVQPRLEVGPAGDRYEREADSIAARVMAMPDPASATHGAATPAAGLVQRSCGCSSASEEPRARRDAGPETLAASDSELTSGGSPLPAATRSYFEGRMGRDLSGVRVHQGGNASAKNASISARAFTYKNHVWLGAHESTAPSFTMAHELAHVMQQTAPGPIGPQRVMRLTPEEEIAGLKKEEDARRATSAAEAKKQKRAETGINMAGKILTDGDITKAKAGSPGAPVSSPVTGILKGATFVLHDPAGVLGASDIGRRAGLGRRSSGEGPGAYVPETGDPTVAHTPMFGPRRPTSTQFEKGQDIMKEADRNAGYRAIWRATARDTRESLLDDVLRNQGSDKKEAKSERDKAIKSLESGSGIVTSAGAWATEDICALIPRTPATLVNISDDQKKPEILRNACANMANLFSTRRARIGTHTNVEIMQIEGAKPADKAQVPLNKYTDSQFKGVAQLYLRAALEAQIFPTISTHFQIDKGAGDHPDPRCFNVGKLYGLIQVALGHPVGTSYGITPSYGKGAADNVWWDDKACGGPHP